MDVQDPVNSYESDAGPKKPSGAGIAARTRSRTIKPTRESDPITSKTRSKRPRCLDKICSICGKRNKNQTELDEHLKIHTIECNFQCLCCERWFKSKKRVYNHLQNQHSIHKEESLKDFVKVIGRTEEEEEEKKRESKNKRKEELYEKNEEPKRTRQAIKEEIKDKVAVVEKEEEQEVKILVEEKKLESLDEKNESIETKNEELKKEDKQEEPNKELNKEEACEEIKVKTIIEIKKEREDDDEIEVLNNDAPINATPLCNINSELALNEAPEKDDKLVDGNLWTVPPSHSSSPPPSENFKREVEIPTIPFEFKKQIHSFLEGKFQLEDLEGRRCGIVRSCPVCCKILSRPSDLQRHMMKHTGERPYACNLCESRFKSVYNLNYHQRAAHGIMVKISPAMEVRLNKRRRTRRLAPVAKKSSNESSPAKLSPDENGFSIKQEELSSESTPSFDPPTLLGTLLEKKSLSQESSSKPNCPVSVFPSNTSSYNPPPLSSPPSASVKPKLESPFSWDNLDIRGEKPLITKIEGIHRITEQNYVLYKCCICDSMHPSLEILCAHMVSQHPTNKDNTCLKCGATFKWRSQLEVHEQVHQVIDPPGAVNPNMMLMGSFNFPMMMGSLPQSLISPASLMSPQSYFSLPHQVNPYINSGLFSTYGQNPTIDTPSEHSSLQPSSKSDHIVSKECAKDTSHTIAEVYTQYPYKCRHCPKSFDRLFSVQRHERIHTGIKPCFCKICGRGFSEKRNLRHHIIRFHSDNNVNNKKDVLKPRTLRPNTSRKLVSFLKKTAVRILNSAEHNKQDSSKESSIKEEEEHSSNSPDIKNNDSSSSSTVEMDSSYHLEGEPEDITVVIPKEVCDEPIQEENVSGSQFLDGDKKEILHDPKRSLIGNRRKGIPVKYTPTQHQDPWKPSLLNFSNLHVDMPPLENDNKASLESSDFKNDEFIEKNALSTKNSISGSRSSFNLLEFANQCQLKGPFSNFRKKLRQNGSILAAYSSLKTEPLEAKRDEDSSVLYNCNYCNKSFFFFTDFNRHISQHEDTRPFKCEFCEYSSRTNSQLKVHMMRHAGIKQYLCKICKYNGVTQSDLNRHYKTRTHFLRARHTCPICGLGFYTPGQTEDHIQSRHKSSSSSDNLQNPGTEEEGEIPSATCLQEG